MQALKTGFFCIQKLAQDQELLGRSVSQPEVPRWDRAVGAAGEKSGDFWAGKLEYLMIPHVFNGCSWVYYGLLIESMTSMFVSRQFSGQAHGLRLR